MKFVEVVEHCQKRKLFLAIFNKKRTMTCYFKSERDLQYEYKLLWCEKHINLRTNANTPAISKSCQRNELRIWRLYGSAHVLCPLIGCYFYISLFIGYFHGYKIKSSSLLWSFHTSSDKRRRNKTLEKIRKFFNSRSI